MSTKIKTIKTVVYTLLFIITLPTYAQLRLPKHFSNDMVLQRESNVSIWGWANATTEIKIKASWHPDTIKITANGEGKWVTKIPTTIAGGPHNLLIKTKSETIQLNNILLGDVFLCSGQSNMEWGGNQNLKEIIDELPYASNPNIRLLQISRYAANTPQEDTNNQWTVLNEKTLKPFSAIGYFIAKKLNKETGVPIGIINASWGGTAAEVWTPREVFDQDEELKSYADQLVTTPYWPTTTGALWNSMLAPLAQFNIKAAFWYQGESNVGTWKGYDKLMQQMIKSWRKAWEQDFPFYFVQIAPFTYNNTDVPKAALLREQQSKTALALPKVGMTVTTDLVDDIKDIHPVQKQAVANRLSDLALVELYNVSIQDYKSPIYKSHKIQDNKIDIDFYYTQGSLTCPDKNISDIFIAGEDQVFHPAKATITGRTISVSSTAVKKPLAVRFGFSETAMPNLFNARGLPVSPFRTDNWKD